MAKRRKSGLGRDLIGLPWQFSALVALGGFAVIRWLLPGFMPESPTLAGVGLLFDPFSWIVLVAFGILSMLAALRARIPQGPGHRQAQAAQPGKASATGAGMAMHDAKPVTGHAHEFRAVEHARPEAWSLDALRILEWKRFELLCARYYEAAGFRTETLDAGPDGGIDVKLFKADPTQPLAVVQCKAWNTRQVGVKEIRELLGVMVHAKVARGIFITTGTFSQDALAFGAASPIQLLDGAGFDGKLRALPHEPQAALLRFAFDADYRTPSCPSCGIKLVARDSKRGPFWGCMHYPRCKSTMSMRP